jgi:hypothetical protein
MYFIDLLAQFSIIMNCAIIFFTSPIYRRIFVYSVDDTTVSDSFFPSNYNSLTEFLIHVIIIEHILKILKIALETCIEDTPEDVANGIKERQQLEKNYIERKLAKSGDVSRSKVMDQSGYSPNHYPRKADIASHRTGVESPFRDRDPSVVNSRTNLLDDFA